MKKLYNSPELEMVEVLDVVTTSGESVNDGTETEYIPFENGTAPTSSANFNL